MQSNSSVIDIALIADNSTMTATLHEYLHNNGDCGRLRIVPQRKKALLSLQRKGPRSTTSAPDLILFDFTEPRRRILTLVQDMVFGSTPPVAPTVLLTNPSSEQLLADGTVSCGNAIMFAPKTLTDFVKKMREHHRDLFLQSVVTLSDLGPILVRLPDTFSARTSGLTRLTA